MKFVKNALISLYINLFIIIFLFVSLLRGLIKNDMGNWIHILLIAGVIISGISNIIFAAKNTINSCKLCKNRDYNSLRKCMKILKFGAIPYFILDFAMHFLIFLFLFAASRRTMIFTPIPLLFFIPICFTYPTVVFTSLYGIGFVVSISRDKKLSKKKFIFHVLLQLCFILDVISTISLLIKYKKIDEIN
ncbi:hypothetical protein CLOBY_08520 [Clostridium saccharobutylicum]|uniref:DUF6652 family protein n=1 Tax=Clostridium saccharobutylicum TaxID=169679 RepID=UPI000983B9E8|nr:DUF6652 family protein [Clostridium saccharobutylicum]AQS08742.1 hypothetical protein CLOBY_08520 [Clostridium saccharobutylicum]MBC2438743.1 hypothetical protein [Clostridium saccharobutylicum]NSB91028.1 hypothetical protein [Clostridium saccharobutylicum]OOM18382.1 hypothetical protein CLSAB_07430 [Clostridium saccharobutylicum]